MRNVTIGVKEMHAALMEAVGELAMAKLQIAAMVVELDTVEGVLEIAQKSLQEQANDVDGG